MQPVTVIVPGCGFGFWHMWGLLRARGIERHEHAYCISGSSLAMVASLCNLDVELQVLRWARLRTQMNLCNAFRVVRTWLDTELPSDCHLLCNDKMTILLRDPVRWSVHSFSFWYSKSDLIDCLMAACIPLVPSRFRDEWFVDCVSHTPTTPHIRLPCRVVRYIPSDSEVRLLYTCGRNEGLTLGAWERGATLSPSK
jgi:hypothetical protein